MKRRGSPTSTASGWKKIAVRVAGSWIAASGWRWAGRCVDHFPPGRRRCWRGSRISGMGHEHVFPPLKERPLRAGLRSATQDPHGARRGTLSFLFDAPIVCASRPSSLLDHFFVKSAERRQQIFGSIRIRCGKSSRSRRRCNIFVLKRFGFATSVDLSKFQRRAIAIEIIEPCPAKPIFGDVHRAENRAAKSPSFFVAMLPSHPSLVPGRCAE